MVLVEVTVVLVLATLVLGVIISLLISLKQWDRNVHGHSIRLEQRMRLAESVRSDIRLAAEVSLPAENTLVIASADGRQTRYEADKDGCRRNAAAPAGAQPSVEYFAIGSADSWNVDRQESGKRPLIVATLDFTPPEKADLRPAPLIVYAGLGSDVTDR
jgi:hypothetical protein